VSLAGGLTLIDRPQDQSQRDARRMNFKCIAASISRETFSLIPLAAALSKGFIYIL